MLFAVVVTLIHCYYGYYATGGPAGVGQAAGRAIRVSIIAVVVLNLRAVADLLGRRRHGPDRRLTGRRREAHDATALGRGPRSASASPPCCRPARDRRPCRWAYGAYDDDSSVAGLSPAPARASPPARDVKYRGVNVGEVERHRAGRPPGPDHLRLSHDFRVPADASVDRPAQDDLRREVPRARVPRRAGTARSSRTVTRSRPPPRPPRSRTSSPPPTRSSSEIDAHELAEVVTSLADTSSGQGDDIAAGLGERRRRRFGLFNDTLDAQLVGPRLVRRLPGRHRDDRARRSTRSAPTATWPSPSSTRAREDFVRLLDTLRARSPTTWPTCWSRPVPTSTVSSVEGDNVMRLLIAREEDLAEIVRGLAKYVDGLRRRGCARSGCPTAVRVRLLQGLHHFRRHREDALRGARPAPAEFRPPADAVLGLGGPHRLRRVLRGVPRAALGATGPASERPAAAQELADDAVGLLATPTSRSRWPSPSSSTGPWPEPRWRRRRVPGRRPAG